MDLSRRLGLLDDTAAALRMVRAELARVEAEAEHAEMRHARAGVSAAQWGRTLMPEPARLA